MYSVPNETEVLAFLSKEARKTNKNNKKLYHYTSFESLLSIIQDRRFRLTRKDLLNDKAESKIGNTDKAMCQYIMSMTERREYISMWAMYGKPSGIKVRLDFSKEEFIKIIDDLNDWSSFKTDVIHSLAINDCDTIEKPSSAKMRLIPMNDELDPIRFAYVAYIDKEKHILRHKGKKFHMMSADEKSIDILAGLVKYDAWEFEKEIRLLAEMQKNDRNYIYLPITENLLKTFTITFNPWISQRMKEMIKKQLNELAGFSLRYRNSSNEGEVDENRL